MALVFDFLCHERLCICWNWRGVTRDPSFNCNEYQKFLSISVLCVVLGSGSLVGQETLMTMVTLRRHRTYVYGTIDVANYVVALTGAGISTESGIPDFRGPKGLWTRDPDAEKLSNIHYYVNDSAIRVKAWQARLDSPVWAAEPGIGHQALARLETRGKLKTVITQNIDGLHQLAGTSPENVIEIHGTVREVVCL